MFNLQVFIRTYRRCEKMFKYDDHKHAKYNKHHMAMANENWAVQEL